MNRHPRTCLDLVSLDRGERVQHKEDTRKVKKVRLNLEKLYINATFQDRMDDRRRLKKKAD